MSARLHAPGLRTLLVVTPALAFALLVALLLANLGLWSWLQHPADDALLAAAAPDSADDRIVIVAIDDASFDELKKRWPWPRSLVARLVARLAAARPAAVGIDLLMLDPDSVDPGGDAALAAALEGVRPRAVLLERLAFDAEAAPLRLPIAPLRQRAVSGFFNFSPDRDHVIRRQRLVAGVGAGDGRDGLRRSFAHEIYQQWRQGRDRGGSSSPRVPEVLRIPYRGPAGTFARVSAHHVLAGRIPANTFEGRVVLVGATYSDSKDVFPTPMPDRRGETHMTGVEIHANTISALIDGRSVRELSPRVSALLALAALAVVLFIGLLWSRRLTVGVAGALLLASVGGYAALFFFSSPLVLPAFPLVVASVGAVPLAIAARALVRRLEPPPRSLLTRVTLPRTATVLQPHSRTSREVSLCCVAADELATAAGQHPDRVAALLSDIRAVIENYGGVLGDDASAGLVGIFGLDATNATKQHAERACRAAVDLQQAAADEGGDQLGWRAAIGIHSCTVTAVTTGARVDCGGDELDVARQIASLTKPGGSQIIISAETERLLPERRFSTEELGQQQFCVGRRRWQLGVYRVLDESNG